MAAPVKGTRGYDSTERHERTRLRRVAVLEAALSLMSDGGYVATTVSAVAQLAGVSVEFIYKQFGDKAGLARSVLDFALVGDGESLPMAQRPHVRRMIAEPDAAAVLTLYAQAVTEVNARAGAFLVALAAAAPTDARLAELWRAAQANRLAGTRAMVGNVAGKTELRMSERSATDIVWALIGPELHLLLRRERSWPAAQYSVWIADTMIHALLGTLR